MRRGAWYQSDLLALQKGESISPSEEFAHVVNYMHRADNRHALRQRLAKLSADGRFRMIGDDVWVRM